VAKTFALDIAKFAEKAGGNVKTVVRKVSIDTLAKVVERTPVGDPTHWKNPPPDGYVGGRLRANWNVSLSAPDLSTTTETDKSGNATTARGAAHISHADGEQDIYIMNSLPYVRRIEYDGWSSQAPAGMVRITVAEFQTFVDAAARSVK